MWVSLLSLLLVMGSVRAVDEVMDIQCYTVVGTGSDAEDDAPDTVECNSGDTMVSCGILKGDNDHDGAYVTSSATECTAFNGENAGSAVAYGRCCGLEHKDNLGPNEDTEVRAELECVTYESEFSSPINEAGATAVQNCSTEYPYMLGCSAWTQSRGVRGWCVIPNANSDAECNDLGGTTYSSQSMDNLGCVAVNGNTGGNGKVKAFANCCKVVQTTPTDESWYYTYEPRCTIKRGGESSVSDGAISTSSCGADDATMCNGYCPDCYGVNGVYADSSENKCRAVMDDTGTQGVHAQAACCKFDMTLVTANPTLNPTSYPTKFPTKSPSQPPTTAPSRSPSQAPSNGPTRSPSISPSEAPSNSPTQIPSDAPSQSPSQAPSKAPTLAPTDSPSFPPTRVPSQAPTQAPSLAPSMSPSRSPSRVPSEAPTDAPTAYPSQSPSNAPSQNPSVSPTLAPTQSPSATPTFAPTSAPSNAPSQFPTHTPSNAPTLSPTSSPSNSPSNAPTANPTKNPTEFPTQYPSMYPTYNPSANPTSNPTQYPSAHPSIPPTSHPTGIPSTNPTADPTWTHSPSYSPTDDPTMEPTIPPTQNPSGSPTTPPTGNPTAVPTSNPTQYPTKNPSKNPSLNPTSNPTYLPSFNPTRNPSRNPTFNPTANPTRNPTLSPTLNPTRNPSFNPTNNPTSHPTFNPTSHPTINPTINPTVNPTINPTFNPSMNPSLNPSIHPTKHPSADPTYHPSKPPSPFEVGSGGGGELQGGGNSDETEWLIIIFSIIVVGLCLGCVIGIWHYRGVKGELEETRKVVAQTQSRLDVLAAAGGADIQMVGISGVEVAMGGATNDTNAVSPVGSIEGQAAGEPAIPNTNAMEKVGEVPAVMSQYQMQNETYVRSRASVPDPVYSSAGNIAEKAFPKETDDPLFDYESAAAEAGAGEGGQNFDLAEAIVDEAIAKMDDEEGAAVETDVSPAFLRMVNEMDPDDPLSSDDSSSLNDLFEERRAEAAFDAALEDDVRSNASNSALESNDDQSVSLSLIQL